jgi:hypothetical protein
MTDDLDRSGDRPAHEIEITPEMIEAGVSVLCAFEPKFETEADAVRHIFGAMMKSRPLASTSSSRVPQHQ